MLQFAYSPGKDRRPGMRKYTYDPRLFDDCDPYRVPYGEEGYDPFLDAPLPRLRLEDAADHAVLAVRQAILDGRLRRYQYERRLQLVRDVVVGTKRILSRTA